MALNLISASYFCWPLPGKDENTFNKQLHQELHLEGEVFLNSTTLAGKFVIRMAVLSFRTKLFTIDKAVEFMDRKRKKVSQENWL